MAISKSGYAAQFIDRDGNVVKFDDIGCMIRYARENDRKSTVAKFFVMDFSDKQWVEAQTATYVKSENTASPMASGLTAFRETASVEEYVTKRKGRVLHFDDLWTGGVADPPQLPNGQR